VVVWWVYWLVYCRLSILFASIGLRRCRKAFARMVRTQPMRLPTHARACVARRGVVRAREAGRSQGATVKSLLTTGGRKAYE